MSRPKFIAFSPKTQTVSGINATDTSVEVVNINAFPNVAAGEFGYITFLYDERGSSENPAEYETATYTGKSGSTLTGLTREVEGTAQIWAADTYCLSSKTAHGDDLVFDHIDNTTTPHGAVSAPTASKVIIRDVSGRAQVADPSFDADIATKNYVDSWLYGNAGAHNSIYRGKDLGTEYTQAQSDVIAAGTFDDLYIGDYWTIGGVVYRIAAFDYYLGAGDTAVTAHHAVIVPDASFGNARMEATNITTNGYTGSEMRLTNLATARTACIDAFKIGAVEKVLEHRRYLSNASSGGLASGSAWTNTKVELMNEVMTYGSRIEGSPGGRGLFDIGVEKSQLPLFTLEPNRLNIGVAWWLRDVASATHFAFVNGSGLPSNVNASASHGVRPAFSIS